MSEHKFEPSNQPHGYEWGDSVEVLVRGEWHYGIFLVDDGTNERPYAVLIRGESRNNWYERHEVRPFKPAGREETAAP